MFGMLVLYNANNNTRLNSICTNMCKDLKISYASGTEINIEKENTDFDLQNGDFFIANSSVEPPVSIPIPTKGSVAASWFKGFIPEENKKQIIEFIEGRIGTEGEGAYTSNLLIKLNSYKHEHTQDLEMNYTKLVHNRVISYLLDGAFTLSLAYLTKNNRSRIIIASKDKDIYFTLVYASDYYCLVWSDDFNVAQSFKEKGAFIYSMTPMSYGGTFVIHPQFLTSKWKKWRTSPNEISKSSSALRAVSIMENYLLRNTVKLSSCLETITFKYFDENKERREEIATKGTGTYPSEQTKE